jgi:hypothetical protein
MAGLTPADAPAVPDDGNPDGPVMIPSSVLTKLGLDDLKPGDTAMITARVVISGTPDAPEAEITAVGDIRPDDPTADLTTLGDDSTESEPEGVTVGGDEEPEESGGIDNETTPMDDNPYKGMGFTPKSAKKKTVSAKDVFGE